MRLQGLAYCPWARSPYRCPNNMPRREVGCMLGICDGIYHKKTTRALPLQVEDSMAGGTQQLSVDR